MSLSNDTNQYILNGIKMLTKVRPIIASIIILTINAALAETDNKNQHYVIGFAQDTLANDWRLTQVNELRDALAGIPNISLIVTDAKGRTAKQISDIEDLISNKVDLLITSPRDGVALTPVISKAYQMGIPVILLQREISSQSYTTLIGADNHSIAQNAAKFLIKTHPQGGNIIILKGIPNASTTIHRTSGFVDEISKNKKFKIVSITTANYLRGDAIKSVENLLESNVKFNIIYAQSDSMASGARIALSFAGKDLNDYSIIGIDYIKEAQTAIREGSQLASFTYPTGGKQGGKYALKILQGESVERHIHIQSKLITKTNVNIVKPIF